MQDVNSLYFSLCLQLISLHFVPCFLFSFFFPLYSLLQDFSLFFKRITSQLLGGVDEWSKNLSDGAEKLKKDYVDFAILFTGEIFSRICRRGSSGK